MLKVPDNFEEMKWSCACGEIATNDAAKMCGLARSTFYAWLRQDKEAFAEYQRNNSTRIKPVMSADSWRNRIRTEELETKRRCEDIMATYHKKSKIDVKLKMARALGMSYGQYVAFAEGYGRL